jgi:hypothetical protein
MSLFWSIEPELAEKVPPSMLDELARFQMCEKVVVDFPDTWRKNVIEIKREVRALDVGGNRDLLEPRPSEVPEWMRAEHALREIAKECEGSGITETDFLYSLQSLSENPVESIIIEACLKHQVTPDFILGEVQQAQLEY